MPDRMNINLKVLLIDTDYYALQAMNGYIAWDRRTRVTYMAENLDTMWQYLDRTPHAELPDVVVLSADSLGGVSVLRTTLDSLHKRMDKLTMVCTAQTIDLSLMDAAAQGGARAYLLKSELRHQIAWAIVYSREHDFLVTGAVARQASLHESLHSRVRHAYVLPKPHSYPQLTGRVRQAIELSVIKGMPAVLAADEMGISLHTIRSYIKDGYRILESADDTEYPVEMSPQERAFMRLTRPQEEE